MIFGIIAILKNWNVETDNRGKLQQAYVVGGVTLLIIAGLVGLVNYELGQMLLHLALIAIAIFFINAIVWALLTAFVLLRLGNSSDPAPTTKPRTRK